VAINLYLDEDVDPLLARVLRERGYDCMSTQEAQNRGITDAEQLILQASSMAKGGEIFVLREAEVRDLEKDIMNLEILTRTAPSKTLVELLNELVPSFTPASTHS